MNIDDHLLNKLSELSRLEFNEEESAEIKKNLKNILDLVEQMNEVDTESVEPLIYMTENQNILRKDVVNQTISKEEALKNAPAKDSDFIKVPKVINK